MVSICRLWTSRCRVIVFHDTPYHSRVIYLGGGTKDVSEFPYFCCTGAQLIRKPLFQKRASEKHRCDVGSRTSLIAREPILTALFREAPSYSRSSAIIYHLVQMPTLLQPCSPDRIFASTLSTLIRMSVLTMVGYASKTQTRHSHRRQYRRARLVKFTKMIHTTYKRNEG